MPQVFRHYSVETVVFTPKAAEFVPSAAAAILLSYFHSQYDGEIATPTSVHVESPAGSASVSTLVMASRDLQWRFNGSENRLSSSWTTQNNVSNAKGTRDLASKCMRPILKYLRSIDESTFQVGRLGLRIRRFRKSTTPAGDLIERYCNEGVSNAANDSAPLRNSREFQIHNLKTYSGPTGHTVNSWVRVSSGLHVNQPVIRVEQDINTLGEEIQKNAFTCDELQEFFEKASDEADAIFELHFSNP